MQTEFSSNSDLLSNFITNKKEKKVKATSESKKKEKIEEEKLET